MKKIITFLLFYIAFNTYSQNVDVPKGINYIRTSKTQNEEAKVLIDRSIKTSEFSEIFESTVMIGPNLWSHYLSSKYFSKREIGIDLNFKIPNGNNIVTRKGRVIKDGNDLAPLWNLLCDDLKESKIRIPSKSELEYYWSIIAYDIEEPIWVAENSKIKILFNLDPTNNKVLFIESL